MKTRLLIPATVCAIALSSTANAQSFSEPYISLFLGASKNLNSDFRKDPSPETDRTNNVLSYDLGGTGGIAIGAQMGANVRGEMEFAYSKGGVSSFLEGGFSFREVASPGDAIDAFTVMANVWKDLDIGIGDSAHIGAGVGLAKVSASFADTDDQGETFPINSSDNVLAAQVGFGFSWNTGNGGKIGLDFKYLATREATFSGVHSDDGPLNAHHSLRRGSVALTYTMPLNN